MYRYFYDNCGGFIIESGVLRKALIPLEELSIYISRNTELSLIFFKTLLFFSFESYNTKHYNDNMQT
jgi:hypothetical protein